MHMSMQNLILVTGGAGFIGSNFIQEWIAQESSRILNFDKLTYAGNPRNLESIAKHPAYQFQQGDIVDRDLVRGLLQRERPRAVVHFAAESGGVILPPVDALNQFLADFASGCEGDASAEPGEPESTPSGV